MKTAVERHTRAWFVQNAGVFAVSRNCVRVDPELPETYPVTVTRLGERTLFTVAPFLREGRGILKRLPAGAGIAQALDSLLEGVSYTAETVGFYTADESMLVPRELPEGFAIRPVTFADAEALEKLLSACTPAERAMGEVTVHDPMAFLVTDAEGRPVAAAGCEFHGKKLADLSVVTHPEARGQGLACAAVSVLVRRLLSMRKIPQYRAEDTNTASAAVCTRLGFVRSFTMEGAVVTYPEE